MVSMTLKTVFVFCVPFAWVAASLAVIVEASGPTGTTNLFWIMMSRVVEVMLLAVLGLFAAQGSALPGSVILTPGDWRARVQGVINYGLLPGLILGLLNYLFFFYGRYSPFVSNRIREMDSVYDVVLVSLDTAVFEETIYRLFLLSSIVFLFRHLYRILKHVQPKLVSVLPGTMGIVLSSLLFALAHTLSGFTAAFTGGMILGFIYFRNGVESAIVAHFAANFLFFSASYAL